ncbi:MAG: carboxymuconolactone decarboxylase family protein [Gemmatimonadota bacterium]
MSHDHSHSEPSGLADFQAFRRQMNEAIFAHGNLTINRFFALDGRAYEEGALGVRIKELMGLVASLVLRCDDCVTYHVVEACRAGASDDELMETFAIGLIVGGSIVIPHLRRAVARLAEVRGATGPAAG